MSKQQNEQVHLTVSVGFETLELRGSSVEGEGTAPIISKASGSLSTEHSVVNETSPNHF